jgi:hypothetical protein
MRGSPVYQSTFALIVAASLLLAVGLWLDACGTPSAHYSFPTKGGAQRGLSRPPAPSASGDAGL